MGPTHVHLSQSGEAISKTHFQLNQTSSATRTDSRFASPMRIPAAGKLYIITYIYYVTDKGVNDKMGKQADM